MYVCVCVWGGGGGGGVVRVIPYVEAFFSATQMCMQCWSCIWVSVGC